jgi:hypothetical protein
LQRTSGNKRNETALINIYAFHLNYFVERLIFNLKRKGKAIPVTGRGGP